MIRRIVNRGFKDQDRTTELTGLDLFTSDNVNGVGKSAVLEAFKLGLLGEIPGKARTLEDLLQFTSLPEMSVEIVAETQRGAEGKSPHPPFDKGGRGGILQGGAVPASASAGGGVGPSGVLAGLVRVERRFLREAGRKERRPIRINRVVKKYEEGDRWVRETLGAVSLSFDPFEFLNLPDRKKRQWILAHSPESVGLDRTVLEALLFGRMVEALFGPGLAREQAICLGFDRDQASVENRNGLPWQNPPLPPFGKIPPAPFAKGGVMGRGGFRKWEAPSASASAGGGVGPGAVPGGAPARSAFFSRRVSLFRCSKTTAIFSSAKSETSHNAKARSIAESMRSAKGRSNRRETSVNRSLNFSACSGETPKANPPIPMTPPLAKGGKGGFCKGKPFLFATDAWSR
ncbi:MAG: hypothetical protein HZA02_08985, partial [Nitrospinae bacterium]|nr:hypothetical protein [Nitrospinota bacterium]